MTPHYSVIIAQLKQFLDDLEQVVSAKSATFRDNCFESSWILHWSRALF